MNKQILQVTERIIKRSQATRQKYMEQMQSAFSEGLSREVLSCGNLAHGFAGCVTSEKLELADMTTPNFGIVTAYNDMLSAHKPYEHYPEKLREYAHKYQAVAQVAGGVPAMCDGVTQGRPGMDLSLFSRDVIALSTAIALSHNMFDGTLCLGICDKIVPGLVIGTLKFGHLPTIFVPGGPMPSGISNDEKAKIRQDFAEGKIDRKELLKGEAASYHSPGTCTFYGTANSNQMLMEIMGLQLPGSSFVNPGTQLRDLLNEHAVKILAETVRERSFERALCHIYDEKAVVNGIIGLLATGGSTNHTLHLIAMARSAGIHINWEDFSDLSEVIPLLARVYPNGAADVNHFHASGGMAFVIRTLLDNGMLHEDVRTILGKGLREFTREPKISESGQLIWVDGPEASLNNAILRPANDAFSKHGGLVMVQGNMGRSVIKTAAVSDENLVIEAPAMVFDEQEDLIRAFKAGELDKDFIAVLPFQGPKHNGMPELHQLTPALTVLQKRGFKIAMVTDGRMSGASGRVPAAIHLTPEAKDGGLISKIQNGDMLLLDAVNGELTCIDFETVNARPARIKDNSGTFGMGRELFVNMRQIVRSSEEGASFIF
ncbi:MAG: phosphogluconate dehydratase [Crocinitomicaceae bacterium]|jgi:phosphogluconate dehydratase|nr:phosphogluconate dehydratase [Crocinitomicaceae bacterium]